jgi:hypothetical protein
LKEPNFIEVPVVKLQQRGLILYQGSIRARDLLDIWDVKRFQEEYLRSGGPGYQREEAEDRAKHIATYVQECQVPLIPSLLLAVKKFEFEEFERGYGVLKIPRREGTVTIIDGQHRGLGFDWIRRSITERKRLFPATSKQQARKLEDAVLTEWESLLDFELPATFVDSTTAAKIASQKVDKDILQRELGKTELEDDDIERVFFFVINKTQKGINPSLKDALMYLIASAGIKGIPVIEDVRWRADVVPLVRDLHYDRDSPLFGLINLIGRKGTQEPVKLNTFVSSLKPLALQNQEFIKLERDKKLQYLKAYWEVIKEMFPYAFMKDKVKEYLILRSISVYALNRLANDVFNWCWDDKKELPSVDDIRKYIEPLKGFDWSKKSQIAAFGGQKGVDEAYKLLLRKLREGNIKKASERLQLLRE